MARRDHLEGGQHARRDRGARARRRQRRHRGLHAPHLLRGRPRDHPPAPPRPDARPHDAGRHLRPDDRRRRGPQARLLVAGQPGRRRPARHPARHRGRGGEPRAGGVQPLRHGGSLHRGRHEPALLPAALLLRDGHAGRQPAHPAAALALRRRAGLRRAAAAAGRHHRPRAARRRRRQHPDLGPAGRPEGGRLRGRPGHRRRRGAGGRVGHPGRPQPHRHPRAHRGCRGRGAVRRAPVLRAGRTTTATTASTSSGTPSAGMRRGLDAWLDEWVHGVRRAGRVHGAPGRRRSGARRSPRGQRPPEPSTTGSTGERTTYHRAGTGRR